MRRFSYLIGIACLATQFGANWPNWRGPTFDGAAPPGEYPTSWSATENMAWKLPLPGRGASSPIVWERRVYLSYGNEQGNNVLACVDWAGTTVWETELGKETPRSKPKASGSNPSAITDGKSLFTYFKSGQLARLDMNGKVIWQKNLQKLYGPSTLWWDLGTSPVLTKNCVVVAVIQTGTSFVAAFDRETGKEVWKQDRPLGFQVPNVDRYESAQSYATPIVATDASGEETIYVLGADKVTAHAAATGAEVWQLGGLNPSRVGNYRSVASPVISEDLLLVPYSRGDTFTAVRLGGKGDVTSTHVAWRKEKVAADVPTPAVRNGRVYLCTDRGDAVCIDARTGNVIWRETLEKHRDAYSSSPVVAGGHVYLTREDGKTFVLKEGDTYNLVRANELETKEVVATPTFADGRIFVRTPDTLYCIGK